MWIALVNVDVDNHRVSISGTREGGHRHCGLRSRHPLTSVDEPMSLEDAVIGLQAYKEVDQRMARLWVDINKAVLLPRMDITKDTLPGIHIQDVSAPFPVEGTLVTMNTRAAWNSVARQTSPSNLCLQILNRSFLFWFRHSLPISSRPSHLACCPRRCTGLPVSGLIRPFPRRCRTWDSSRKLSQPPGTSVAT